MSQLNGRVALVTGGSRGIGAAIATRLAEDGADVALTYRAGKDNAEEVAARIERTGRRALTIQADSSDPDAVTEAVERAVRELGRLDILVNNAGVFPHGPIEEVSAVERDEVIAVHVTAAFAAAQAASRYLGQGGRIISIGSNLGQRVPFPGLALYAMTKSALDGLTKALARELGPRGHHRQRGAPRIHRVGHEPAGRPFRRRAAGGVRARPLRHPGGRRGHRLAAGRPGRPHDHRRRAAGRRRNERVAP
jgi:NAD(P)-dependent dehydrogenase (short-subunit alcohol dehydrogenase family)